MISYIFHIVMYCLGLFVMFWLYKAFVFGKPGMSIKLPKKLPKVEDQIQEMVMYSFFAHPEEWVLDDWYNAYVDTRYTNKKLNVSLSIKYQRADSYSYSFTEAIIYSNGEQIPVKHKYAKILDAKKKAKDKEALNKQKIDTYNKQQAEKLKREQKLTKLVDDMWKDLQNKIEKI